MILFVKDNAGILFIKKITVEIIVVPKDDIPKIKRFTGGGSSSEEELDKELEKLEELIREDEDVVFVLMNIIVHI